MRRPSTRPATGARAYAGLLRHGVLPVAERLSGQRMMRHLGFLENAQWWPAEQVRDYQNAELQKLVRVAYDEVPFYRDLMDRASAEPGDIKTREDLQRLPIVTKDMLRANYPERTTRETGFRWIEACSSGSTGQNFYIRQDSETAGRLRAILLLGFGWAGWTLGARHLQTGISPDRGLIKSVKDWLLRCSYASAFNLTNEKLDEMLQEIRRRDIRHVRGFAGSLYLLAKRAAETDFECAMESVVSWGDNLYDHYREAIERVFQRRVFDMYGCAEGIYIASQCGENANYHTYSTEVIVETVDDAGAPCPPGESGHVLLTRLHPGAMPMIRYRVGDWAALEGDVTCPCGRGWELFGRIQGRDTDMVLTPSGNRLLVHFFTGILEYFPEIVSFQVVQEQLASIVLRIVPGVAYSNETAERIRQALRSKGASDLRIDIELVDEIPLPVSQKRRFVVSKIAAGGPLHPRS